MKKYVLIGSSSYPGSGAGISQAVYAQILSFKESGYKVICACPSAPNNRSFKCLDVDVEFVYGDASSDPLEVLKVMIDVYNNYNPVIIINNDNPYVSNLIRFAKCCSVSISHMNSTTIQALTIHDSFFCDYVGAISHFMLSDLRKRVIDKSKVILIPNIFIPDCELLIKDNKGSFKIKIVYSGGSSKNKGIKYLKKLLLLLNKQVFADQFDIDLFGNYNKSDICFFESLTNLNIIIHGFVSRNVIYKAFVSADFLLFPSLNEGLPMTIIEAMSAKTAILSIDGTGGVSDLVLNGFNGLCVDKIEWVDMAISYLNLALSNRKKLNRLKESSLLIFESNFNKVKFIEIIEELIVIKSLNEKSPPDSIDLPNGPIKLLDWHRVPKEHVKYSLFKGLKQRFGFLSDKEYFL